MVSKHTPGPWTAVENKYYWEIRYNDWAAVASVCESKYLEDGDNGEANARLMAAAPELLEALKMLATHCEGGLEDDSDIEHCRAVIAKAEGRE